MFVDDQTKIHPAFIPVFLFSSITTLVFTAGVFGYMPLMVDLIYYSGWLLAAYYVYRIVSKQYQVEKLLVPSTISFLVLSGVMMVLLKDMIYLHYDNFSHWALIVKEMARINRLPDHTTMITFENYPPGSAVFIYFIGSIVGFTEGRELMAQAFLLVSNIVVLLVFCQWKRPAHLLLSILASVILLIVIQGNIYNLLVDTLLGVIAVSISIIAYYYRADWKKSLLVNTPLLSLLLLVKDSGKIFFLVNVLIILAFVYSYQVKTQAFMSSKMKTLAVAVFCIVLVPLCMNILWGDYTKQAYPDTTAEDHKFALTKDRFLAIDKTDEAAMSIGPKLLEASTSLESNNVQAIFILNAVSFLFIVATYMKKRTIPKRLLYAALFVNLFYFLYIASLYVMYLFLMPEKEAIRLAGFGRYQSTVVIYFIGIMMTALILEWSKATFQEKPIYKVAAILGLGFLFLYPFYEHVPTITTRPDVLTSIRWEVKQLYGQIKKEKPTVLYYSPASKDDRGYLKYVLKYEQLSNRYHIISELDTDESKEKFTEWMRKSDYLAVIESDESFQTFVNTDQKEGVYKIEPPF
jgi:hypothetical protein